MLIFDQFKKGDKPLLFLSVGVLMGMSVLLSGLWYLQVMSSKHYADSQKTQSLRQVRFPSLRGKILDRNLNALAENKPCYNLNLYIEELGPLFRQEYNRKLAQMPAVPKPKTPWYERFYKSKKQKNPAAATEFAARQHKARFAVVSNIVYQTGLMLRTNIVFEEGRFLSHYTNRLALPMPVLENLKPEQVALFLEQPARPPGVNLDMHALRVYTNGTLAAHLLGHIRRTENISKDENDDISFDYCLPDYEGKVGLEGAFDQELRGKAGVKSLMVNNIGFRQSERVEVPAEPGQNIVLTIDNRLQRTAEQALYSQGADTKGAILVMEAQTGDLLAVASSPTFDPNLFIPRMLNENWEKLNDPNLNPTLNRATYGAYAPGSIFKIIIGLAGLETGSLDPSEFYTNSGSFRFNAKSHVWKDLAPPGRYDFRRAFLKSSNSYFIFYGLKAGFPAIMDMAERFHLGEKTKIPLMQENSGFFPTEAWVEKRNSEGEPIQPGDVANICIGQGTVTVTPLQMVVMTAAVANGGSVFWPRLVQRIEAREENGGIVNILPKAQLRGALNLKPAALKTVCEAMLADVEDQEGTGKASSVPGLRVCGKTGTAQVIQGGVVVRHDVWFVSYAPFEHPRYAVVILVEGGGSGGGTCAPMARQIYQKIKEIEGKI
jgi:penicillin-binding protein 2